MQQIWITRPGGPDVLTVREGDAPEPRAGEIAIDVHAAGVNFADVLARMGMYPDAPPLPAVVGYEVAGTVRARGEGVDLPEVGTRVVAMTRFGGYASVVSVPAEQVVAIPPDADLAAAAAIPVNYLTAELAIAHFGNLEAGERILIQNAGGGVGVAAIQLAAARGAFTIGTASAWKHDYLREEGLDAAIDYRRVDVVEAVRAITDGAGVDVIIDPVGGRSMARSRTMLAPLGRVVMFGLSESVVGGRRSRLSMVRSALRTGRVHPLALMGANHAIAGINIGHLWGSIDRVRPLFADLVRRWEEEIITPRVHAILPFREAGSAHRLLQERRNVGKVVLMPDARYDAREGA